MSEENEETTHKPRRERSPAYPGIDLAAAIGRAQTLYRAERRNSAPINAILEHWGYSPGSGRGLTALAALKHFGLLQDQGSGDRRQARLTPRALRILLDAHEDSTEREKAIRDAALQPKIHRELWEMHEGDLPSDATLRTYLSLERNFTDRAVRHFIPQFRRTVAFAELEQGQEPMDEAEERLGEEETPGRGHDQSRTGTGSDRAGMVNRAGLRTVQLPLSGSTAWVTLEGPFPLSEEAWGQMLAMLEIMKSGLTKASDSPKEGPGEGDEHANRSHGP
jgi:hypothetical protein